jgi:hypothetical protein
MLLGNSVEDYGKIWIKWHAADNAMDKSERKFLI